MLDFTRELVRASYDDYDDVEMMSVRTLSMSGKKNEQDWEDNYSQYDSDDYENPDYEYDE